jgi:hypothetical protein
MKFSERPGDAPDALRAWFYPGDNFGQEFVYPKARAIQLAQTTNMIVPAVAADTLDDSAIKTVAIVAVTPDQKEVEVATVIQTAPPATVTTVEPVVQTAPPAAAVTRAPVVADKETEDLPHTASTIPLIALLGALSIALALGLKLIMKLAA